MKKGAETQTVNVIQGNYQVSNDPTVVMTTILGSCVAVCLFDISVGIGGMNHFLLPERKGSHQNDVRFGANAIELLINGLLRAGADKKRIRAKLFGGGTMSKNLWDIGKSNANFAQGFLANEKIPCVGSSLGGTEARRIRFWPTLGKAQVLHIPASQGLQTPMPVQQPRPDTDITLF